MVDVSALQASVDHLRALNTTLVELRGGQRDLEQAVRVHRERLHDLLQEPGCQGCAETLSQAHGLELGADFSQVQARSRPLEPGGFPACCSRGPGQLVFPRADPTPLHILRTNEGLPGRETPTFPGHALCHEHNLPGREGCTGSYFAH